MRSKGTYRYGSVVLALMQQYGGYKGVNKLGDRLAFLRQTHDFGNIGFCTISDHFTSPCVMTYKVKNSQILMVNSLDVFLILASKMVL